MRVVSEMSLGVGALALIGGEVVILAVLTGSAAAIVGIFGYIQASSIGVGAIAGFFSAYANVRLQLPLIVANGLAATIGAGATAQLGAMRISEEIDALEVIGIRSIPYLVTTRVLGGLLVVPPLYCITFVGSVFTTRSIVLLTYHQGAGGVRPLLQHLPAAQGRPGVGARMHRAGGDRHADPHLLRLHRLGRPRGCR